MKIRPLIGSRVRVGESAFKADSHVAVYRYEYDVRSMVLPS